MLSRLSLKLTCFTVVFLSLASISFAEDKAASSSGDTLTGMTITELAKFDGKDGHKAYVAVDSIIYDVTDVKAWKGGQHKGNKAGSDITAKISKAPHAKKPITKLNKVGKLIATPAVSDTTQN
jgi:predicted heme/steroid binding protein